jgi:hypothetical protein
MAPAISGAVTPRASSAAESGANPPNTSVPLDLERDSYVSGLPAMLTH